MVTAQEARAGKDRKNLALKGGVALDASDGFRLTTDDATYEEDAGVVKAPGKVAFTKGGLAGSGVGMTYDKNNDVLTLLAEPDVTMAGTEGSAGTSFKAGAAVLDRLMDVLVLSNGGHAQRGEQTFEAATITARLSPEEEYVRLIELRGDARVAGGGGALDAMSAQAIDLLYLEGGDTLDRVTLTGNAAAALTGKNRQRASSAPAGRRQLLGGALELQLAPDGTLVHAGGRDGIRFDLPVTEKARASSIQAKTFDANGTPGAGLTSAAFVEDVVYREEGASAPPRAARSRTLDLSLDHDDVTSAMFRGGVAFEDGGLAACAAQVRYIPQGGALQLSGADAGGGPRASDERLAIAAEAIDVTLQGTQIDARGAVKTVLRPTREARGACLPRQESKDAAKKRDAGEQAAASVEGERPGQRERRSPRLRRRRRHRHLTGNASLWQGDTSMRADELRLDQEKGDLLASGSARASLMLGGKPSVGRGDVIRYEDAKRVVSYESRRPPPHARGAGRRPSGRATPAAPPAPTAPAAALRRPRAARGRRGRRRSGVAAPAGTDAGPLVGPQGELRAWRIEMVLSPDAGKADRIEAYDDVTLRVEMQRASGDRSTYFAEDERYVMTGTAIAPVCVVDPSRATTGKTLVFYRAADKVLVDGNEETRTQTKSGGACATSPAR